MTTTRTRVLRVFPRRTSLTPTSEQEVASGGSQGREARTRKASIGEWGLRGTEHPPLVKAIWHLSARKLPVSGQNQASIQPGQSPTGFHELRRASLLVN